MATIDAIFAVLLGYYSNGRGQINSHCLKELAAYMDEGITELGRRFPDPHPLAKCLQRFSDAPVTIDEVNTCIEECLAIKQTELHMLGWEWEMGMTPYLVQEAKHRGIKLLLLNIPREVMEHIISWSRLLTSSETIRLRPLG